ncbi:uncharacterized protein [Diadema setosum]|uniref:uncharacterized protein n=1 Tax=Diadema setosum TaxID=31175 RepID=UPI003B3B4BE1
MLDQYDQLNELTWHEGQLPADEVWIKVEGDKGGGGKCTSPEQSAEHTNHSRLPRGRLNIQHRYSPQTDAAPDGGLGFIDKEASIKSMFTVQQKKVRLFMFGDYEFLTRMYGLTGPNGRHCYLYCTSTKQGMAAYPSERQSTSLRTMNSLKASLEEFKLRGVPKEANIVIREPFFNISLDQVCLPGLHMSLGIFHKHYNSLCNACHALNLKIAQKMAGDTMDQLAAKEAFSLLVRKLSLQSRVQEVNDEIAELIEQHTTVGLLYPENEPPAVILQMADEKKKEETELEKAISNLPGLPPGAGPVSSALEDVLQKLHVARQAYHGPAFVGNHVHKCLKVIWTLSAFSKHPNNVDLLTSLVTDTVKELCPNDAALQEEAAQLHSRYNQLLKLFGHCHRGINSGAFLTDDDIIKLDANIQEYFIFVRENFGNEKITPKQHLLEDHTIPWLLTIRNQYMTGAKKVKLTRCKYCCQLRVRSSINLTLKVLPYSTGHVTGATLTLSNSSSNVVLI